MERVTDEELVRLAQNGDPAAFDEIVERHKGAVFRAALSALRNREDAEDVTQETFITAYRKLDTFRGESQLRTWLSRIAWNRSMDHRRRGRFRRFLHLDEPAAIDLPSLEADPERSTLASSAHARVRREIVAGGQKLREAEHAVQRRADLMAHGRQELGLGFRRRKRSGSRRAGRSSAR